MSLADLLAPTDTFARRHLGPTEEEQRVMLAALGLSSLEELVERTVPSSIRFNAALNTPAAKGEAAALAELKEMAAQNKVFRSFIGMGYHDTHTPGVVLRNIIENPGWYTAYTPYQAEIAQGRLEMLLNFQTMICELSGMDISNASLLDEATAAAEAMTLADRERSKKNSSKVFFVDQDCHPQTIALVQARAEPLGIQILVGDFRTLNPAGVYGALVQYPATDGKIHDYAPLAERLHAAGGILVVAADLLALTLLRAPGDFGADVVVGSAQRFGVPLGFGGPHAGFMACKDDFKRGMPGRIIGVSKDAQGNTALRMALQTREQHIRRQKATSNICTAQVLLAVCAAAYAIYHGPEGLKAIARRVHGIAVVLADALRRQGHAVDQGEFFDTFRVRPSRPGVLEAARERGINLRDFGDGSLGIALDETVTAADIAGILASFGGGELREVPSTFDAPHARTTAFLTHPTFHRYHGEHEMLRYLHRLEAKDLAMNTSMISLGSCTMKLNATSEMIPVTWPEFGKIHPFCPPEQARGYHKLFADLEAWLGEITGFDAVSLQPNAGSQGEYAGLLAIRGYHVSRGDHNRNVCLIPSSAHGTNPASAVMAGMEVVVTACDARGNIDVADLRAKVAQYGDRVAALMVTYPSTHGVFETSIREICEIIHGAGGQVYMDGANMNAQVGLCRPGDFGPDVCHLNLHKTFCIPHGGGGPGMGPIGVKAHLAPFLPGHPVADNGRQGPIVSAAPWGSASILVISWMYIRMMGPDGLKKATQLAILNANYIAKRLEGHYDVLYRGENGFVAHECILDTRPLKIESGTEVEDIAKRLMDYGYHAPTMSFPVAGTLMVEPTESESKHEIDRFCEALIGIRDEMRAVAAGELDRTDNPLKNAPHTQAHVIGEWKHAYGRELAAFPAPWTREHKHWPTVGRIDNAYGDRHLFCSCPPVEEFKAAAK